MLRSIRVGWLLPLTLLIPWNAAADEVAPPQPPPPAPVETLTRPMGMGHAFRGHGAGNGALYSNPAAMSLLHAYSMETAYLNLDGRSILSGSVVDTKTSMIGAGVGYEYEPVADVDDNHAVRLGLSAALVPGVLTIGGLGKFAWIGVPDESGLSLDLGALVYLKQTIGIGVVAHNLMEATEVGEYRSFGLGVAYTGFFTAAFDLVIDPERSGAEMMSYHGGLEFLLGKQFPLRLGYEAIPATSAQYLSFGLGALSQLAGLQLSFRQRLDDGDEQYFSISLNYFM